VQQILLQTTRGAGQAHCPLTQTGAAGLMVQSRHAPALTPQFWFVGGETQFPRASQQPLGQVRSLHGVQMLRTHGSLGRQQTPSQHVVSQRSFGLGPVTGV
jgi:hypothetical protein